MEPFFESGTSCESNSDFELGQSNMSLEDVAGVFFMLAVCVFLSLCTWILKVLRKCFRCAKKKPSEGEVWKSLANMPPTEQISFVLEAVKGKLLQTYEVIQNWCSYQHPGAMRTWICVLVTNIVSQCGVCVMVNERKSLTLTANYYFCAMYPGDRDIYVSIIQDQCTEECRLNL